MKNIITIIFCIPCLAALLLNVECSKPLTNQEDEVTKMCKRTSHFNLCMTILFTDTRSPGADAKGLAKIVMEKDMFVSNEILSTVQKLARDTSKDLAFRAKCARCVGRYEAIVTDLLPRANKGVDSHKFGDAIQSLKDVVEYAKACDDQFSKGNDKSPIVNMSVHDISEIAIDILQTI